MNIQFMLNDLPTATERVCNALRISHVLLKKSSTMDKLATAEADKVLVF